MEPLYLKTDTNREGEHYQFFYRQNQTSFELLKCLRFWKGPTAFYEMFHTKLKTASIQTTQNTDNSIILPEDSEVS